MKSAISPLLVVCLIVGVLLIAIYSSKGSVSTSAPGVAETSTKASTNSPTVQAVSNSAEYRDTKVARGCVHYRPMQGVVYTSPDHCVTGTAYLFHSSQGGTYIERFDTGQGSPVYFDDMQYPGNGPDTTGIEDWSFSK